MKLTGTIPTIGRVVACFIALVSWLSISVGESVVYAGSSPTPRINIIYNSGFEEGIHGWRTWYADGDPKESIDHDVFRTGNASLRLESYESGDRVIVHMHPRLPVYVGEKFELYGWVKTDLQDEGGSTHFRVQFKGKDGQNIPSGHIQYSERVQGRNDWTLVKHSFVIPEHTASLAIEIALERNVGTVWWDDLALYLITP